MTKNLERLIKRYNKRISKSKSKLTYIPISLESAESLSKGRQAYLARVLKNVDLRKEIKEPGNANISVSTYKIYRIFERANIVKTSKKQETKTYYKGKEIPPQNFKKQEPKIKPINIKEVSEDFFIEKFKKMQQRISPEYEKTRLTTMKENYLDSLYLQFITSDLDYSIFEKIENAVINSSLEEFKKIYDENIELQIIFEYISDGDSIGLDLYRGEASEKILDVGRAFGLDL